MKTDGFGIEHQPECRGPQWRTRLQSGRSIQYCRSCQIEWHTGDPSTPLQPTQGWRNK